MNRHTATTEELLSHADWVRRLSRALLADPNEAEDVAQDAWVAALRRPPAAGDGMRAWWARVVRSTASNRRRSAGRRAEHEQRAASERSAATDPQVESTLEAHRRLAVAIDALDEPLRNVIVEHYFHGQSSGEIAGREGVADSTIRTRLQRALERLRRELDERAGGDRKAWAGLLAPLARIEVSGTAAGLLALSLWTKCAAAAVVALVGVGAFAHWRTRAVPEPVSAAEAPASDSTLTKLSTGAPLRERKREPAASAETAAGRPPRTEPVARVEARVLDAHGAPIAGVRMRYCLRPRAQDAPEARSDASGRVELAVGDEDVRSGVGQPAGLAPGTWAGGLVFTCTGYERRQLSALFVLGQSTSLGDVVLGEGADLSGRCIGSDGSPLAGARVSMLQPCLSLSERRSAELGPFGRDWGQPSSVCAADGSFTLLGVPVGLFRACASCEGRASEVTEPLQLVPGERRVLPDLVLRESASAIRGKVVGPDGQPEPDAEIEYSFGARDEFVGTMPEKDGSFVLTGIASDAVDLYARGSRGESGEACILGARPGETGLVLRIPPPRRFEVRVLDSAGAPLGKYSVGLYCEDGTGGGGSAAVVDGITTLTARARPFRIAVQADGYAPIKQGLFTQQDVPARIEFRLPSSISVHGRVLRGGVPQRGLELRLDPLLDAPRQRLDGLPAIASPGTCSTSAADGSFALRAERSGRHALWVRGARAAPEYVRILDVDVQRGADGLDIELEPSGAIEGRVTMTAQTCARAAQVMYTCGIEDPRAASVAADGTFRIQGLAPGRWWLRTAPDGRTEDALLAAGSECEAGCVAADVRAGETAHCTFDVSGPERRRVDGRLLLRDGACAGWVATIAAESSWWNVGESAVQLDGAGAFALVPRTLGPQLLSLRSTGTSTRDDSIEAHVLVPAEGLRWSLACELGALDLEGPPGAEIELRAVLENGATWTTHALLDTHGRIALDALPAARASVRISAGSAPPQEVEIPARGRAQLRLP